MPDSPITPPEAPNAAPAGPGDEGVGGRPFGRRSLWGVVTAGLLVLAALLFVVANHNSKTPSTTTEAATGQLSTSTTTTAPQAATSPSHIDLTPAVPTHPATAAAGSTTSTTAAPAAKPAPTTTTTVAPTTCKASDLRFSTSTNAPAYVSGQPVQITTQITDVVACIYTPTPGGVYSCPTSVGVFQGSSQVWPSAGQSEQCSSPRAMTMEPGATQTVSAVWNGQVPGPNGTFQAAPAGTYTAAGGWYWTGGSSFPTSTFTIS